jgi:hypothetical protein
MHAKDPKKSKRKHQKGNDDLEIIQELIEVLAWNQVSQNLFLVTFAGVYIIARCGRIMNISALILMIIDHSAELMSSVTQHATAMMSGAY